MIWWNEVNFNELIDERVFKNFHVKGFASVASLKADFERIFL